MKKYYLIGILIFTLLFISSCYPRPICGNGICEAGEKQTCPRDCEFIPEKCIFKAGLSCLSSKVTEDYVIIAIQNTLGYSIQLEEASLTNYDCSSKLDAKLGNGEKYEIGITCKIGRAGKVFNSDILINYLDIEKGTRHSVTGQISSKIEKSTCSNGIMDGREEGVDCGGLCPTACEKEEILCTDSDGGKDYYVKGTATLAEKHADYCSDTYLVEYSCWDTIKKNDWVILTADNEDIELQYKGADKCTADSPVAKFYDANNDITTETSINPKDGTFTLRLSGKDFNFQAVDCSYNDADIQLLYEPFILGERYYGCENGCSDGACTPESTGSEFLIGSSTNKLEVSEELLEGANREVLGDVVYAIGAKELNALASGTVTNNNAQVSYSQYLYLVNISKDSGYVAYLEDDSDKTSDFLFFKNGKEIAEYELQFNPALQSVIKDSSLEQIEKLQLKLFGEQYTIIEATNFINPSTNTNSGVKLVLQSNDGQKLELQDNDITDSKNSNSLKVNGNTIDDALVIISGSFDKSKVIINRITIIMNADDNFFVPPQGTLSATINKAGAEPQVLFTENWDIQYRGLSQPKTESLLLKPGSSSKYMLTFIDGDGYKVSVPIASLYGNTLELGDLNKSFINAENKVITKNAYILLTDTTRKIGERKSLVLQYKGADKITSDSPVIKLRNLGSEDIIEIAYSDKTPLATLKIGGSDFNVYKAPDTDLKSNDFNIQIDLDGDGTLESSGDVIPIVTSFGAEIYLSKASAVNEIEFTIRTPVEATENLKAYDITGYMAPSESKLQLYYKGNLNLRTPEGENNVRYGYTSYGSFITYRNPTNEQSSLQVDYPQQQISPLVYIVSTSSSSSSGSSGEGGPAEPELPEAPPAPAVP